MSSTTEAELESVIELHLLTNGFVAIGRDGFDAERAIFPETVLEFIRDTQPKEWEKLEALHGEKTGEQVLGDLCKWMDANGSLATLRHGLKCYGRTLRAAYFKPAHGLNPELDERYGKNRVGITRQLHFSATKPDKSVDVTFSVNGIPVATAELKNPREGRGHVLPFDVSSPGADTVAPAQFGCGNESPTSAATTTAGSGRSCSTRRI